MRMPVIAWLVEGTRPGCVDAVRTTRPEGADVVLRHVGEPDIPGLAHGAYAGLLGRGRPELPAVPPNSGAVGLAPRWSAAIRSP